MPFARAGDLFATNGLGTPMLGVDRDGNLAPLKGIGADPVSTNEINVPAAHTAAVITLAAVTDEAHVVSGVIFSYAAAANLPSEAAPGRLTIADGSDTIFDIDVPKSGCYAFPFIPPKQGHAGRAMTVTLADGGAAVQGRLNLIGHWTVSAIAGGELNFDDEMNSGLLELFF